MQRPRAPTPPARALAGLRVAGHSRVSAAPIGTPHWHTSSAPPERCSPLPFVHAPRLDRRARRPRSWDERRGFAVGAPWRMRPGSQHSAPCREAWECEESGAPTSRGPSASGGSDSGPHRRRLALSIADRTRSRSGDPEKATRASAAHWKRLARSRRKKAFVFESLQCRVDRPHRIVASGALAEIAAHRQAIRFVAETCDFQQSAKF